MSYSADLSIIWVLIIAFAIFAYVVMDGFDLGIGILFPTLAVGAERDQAMNSIAPVWDGNETWLVFGGGVLLAAFPLAYSIILPATYPPMIAMLWVWYSAALHLNSAGAIRAIAGTGMLPSPWDPRSLRSLRESSWERSCRGSRSCIRAMPATGSTG